MTQKATDRSGSGDDLRLEWNEPFCNLARALIKRMWKDSRGQVGTINGQTNDDQMRHVRRGIEFMDGFEFRHYCELLGANPDDMLRMIRARENGAD